MDIRDQIGKAKDLLAKSTDIVIVTHLAPSEDAIGSSLALALGLETLGKKVTIVCPDQMTVNLSSFVGVQRIVRDIGRKNFVIGLDYEEGSIERVSYAIEGNRFNLVIEPRAGFPQFDEGKVHFSYGGAKADCIFIVDTVNYGGLGDLYESEKEFFGGRPVISIDHHTNNAFFGNLNIVDSQIATTSELVALTLSGFGITINADIATNILNALYGGTNNFQNQSVTASAFDLASVCMKAGAVRFAVAPVTPAYSGQMQQPAQAPEQYVQETPYQEAPVATPMAPQQAAPVMHHQPQEELQQSQQPSMAQPAAPAQQQPPSEWLKPKIYKSTNMA